MGYKTEFGKLWGLLTDPQKTAVLQVMQSFKNNRTAHSGVVEEAQAPYQTAHSIPEQTLLSELTDPEINKIMFMIKTLLQEDEFPPEQINLQQYNRELQEAEEEYNEGRFITHEEMVKKVSQWGK